VIELSLHIRHGNGPGELEYGRLLNKDGHDHANSAKRLKRSSWDSALTCYRNRPPFGGVCSASPLRRSGRIEAGLSRMKQTLKSPCHAIPQNDLG
jgi:hypothetical protein